MHGSRSPLTVDRYKRSSVQHFASRQILRSDYPCFGMRVNDTFLVTLESVSDPPEGLVVQVFCFDEDVQMAGGQSMGLWD